MTATTAAPGVRPGWLTHELFPFESRFVEVEGHVVHYVDEGLGPTLLMLHGNPTWSFVYRHLILLLRDRFRCVAPDYPGFGLSRAAPGYDLLPESHEQVIRALVDRLGLVRFAPVMQDWGGPIGLHLAARDPGRISALVIGNTWGWPVGDDPHFVRFSRALGGTIGGIAIRHLNAFVNVMIPLGTRRRKLRPDEMAAYRRPLDTAARREATHVLPREIVASSAFHARVERGLAALAGKPTLICWGEADLAFRERERLRFERSFPGARTVLLPGAGHFIQEDAPAEIAAALRAWWPEHVDREPRAPRR